jgi:hypothetical protein
MNLQNDIGNEVYSLLIIDDELEIIKSIARQFRNKYKVFQLQVQKRGFGLWKRNIFR